MSVPKSVIKIKKDGIEYVSNVDRVNYTMKELSRAALRDTGKFICNRFRKLYYSSFKRKKGRVGRFTQYWVRKRECDLQVGLKPNAFYGGFQELGSSKTKRLGLLTTATETNVEEIRKIQSKYLSAIEDELKAKAIIDEDEYEGGSE